MTIENLAPPPSGRLLVKRQGSSITRRIPKPVVVIRTRFRFPTFPFPLSPLRRIIARLYVMGGTIAQSSVGCQVSLLALFRSLDAPNRMNSNPATPAVRRSELPRRQQTP
jgi:hypothetical protein